MLKLVMGTVLLFLALATEAKKEYKPSQKVLEKMADIELERYQRKFNYPMKHSAAERRAKNQEQSDLSNISLAQGASIMEATLDQIANSKKDEQEIGGVKRINKVYGARSSYIANTLLTDDEYLNCFLIWALVFGAVIYGLNKIMKANLQAKPASKAIERLEAFSETEESASYNHMPAPKSLSEI